MYEIIIGRDEERKRKLGLKGCIFIGKNYVQMGHTYSTANPVFLDVATSHVVYVCGKRGSGKSYTLGVIAEGIAALPKEISQNLAVVIFDTMGIYWTMKYPNKKDKLLLEHWNLKPEGFKNVVIYVPKGFFTKMKSDGLEVDRSFSLNPADLNSEDWLDLFRLTPDDPVGIVISEAIGNLKNKGKEKYDIEEIIDEIKKNKDFKKEIKLAAIARFNNVKNWGIFDKNALSTTYLIKRGEISIIDLSCYSNFPNSWDIKNLVVGVISKNLFMERMKVRKKEEFQELQHELHEFKTEALKMQHYPLVWILIDEAHEFIPKEGNTLATKPLITLLREGRQPGISLVLATQQPGKIHTDVITQSDIVISHRITAQIDIRALEGLTQTYMQESLAASLNMLPHTKGAAVVFDDTNERVFPIQIRPRITWHGGASPVAVHEEELPELK